MDTSPKERFEKIFSPGSIWTIQGPLRGKPMGTGKSTLGVQIVQRAIECGYAAMGNILFKSPIRDEKGNILNWKVTYPNGYQKARTLAEVVYFLVQSGALKRRQRALLIVDEGGMAVGIRGGAGGGMQSKEGVNVMNLAAQIRKLNLCIVVIGLGDRFFSSLFRLDEPGSIITGTMRRIKLPGYDIREIIEVRTAAGSVLVNTMPVRGLARPQDWLKVEGADDGPVFESFSPATFGMGVFRKSRKAFDIAAFLTAMSDTISENATEVVAEFLDREGGTREPKSETGVPSSVDTNSIVKDEIPSAYEPVLPNRAEQARAYIRAGGKSDSEIAKLVIPPLTRQRVQYIRSRMSTATDTNL